jgi:hypothetical protein
MAPAAGGAGAGRPRRLREGEKGEEGTTGARRVWRDLVGRGRRCGEVSSGERLARGAGGQARGRAGRAGTRLTDLAPRDADGFDPSHLLRRGSTSSGAGGRQARAGGGLARCGKGRCGRWPRAAREGKARRRSGTTSPRKMRASGTGKRRCGPRGKKGKRTNRFFVTSGSGG